MTGRPPQAPTAGVAMAAIGAAVISDWAAAISVYFSPCADSGRCPALSGPAHSAICLVKPGVGALLRCLP
ncbi:hypothetical protein [Nocardia sp. NPDC047038]|uniref:hypothetical protein n=1 Tax=Nocardia sp. NPDC047038 TaxID=3154338 RepID=UPI0033F80E60